MMTAQVAAAPPTTSSSSITSKDGSGIISRGSSRSSHNSRRSTNSRSTHSRSSTLGSSSKGTLEDSNSLTSSIQMNNRGENSTCSSFANELSLPSSFASSVVGSPGGSRSSQTRGGGGRGGVVRLGATDDNGDGGVESGFNNNLSSSQQSISSSPSQQHQQQQPQDQGENNGNIGALEVYNGGQGGIIGGGESRTTTTTDSSSPDANNEEDQLALRISKETKPMMHLLRLLKDMDATNSGDPKARASLIDDFEKEVTLIEHRIKDENLIMNGEQPPLPMNWIALEDPDSGDVYYANEATGETQWERPGLITELKERLEDMNNSHYSNMSNNYDGGTMEVGMQNNNNSSMSNNYDNTRNNGNEGENNNMSNNNFDQQGGMGKSNGSNNFNEQQAMHNSNMSNNANESNMSNNYDQQGMGNSNASNNYNEQQAMQNNSNMSNNYRDNEDDDGQRKNNNNSYNNNLNESDPSTFQSSLTDSNNGEGLPQNWIALEDPDTGEMYYANEATGESTWDRPAMPLPLIMPEEVQGDDNNNNAVDDGEDGLPPDWVALEDADSGDTYYLNQVTMATTWDRPGGDEGGEVNDMAQTNENNNLPPADEGEPANERHGELPPGWEAVFDESSGDYYYAHEVTGETQWERPEFSRESDVIAADDNNTNQGGPPDDGGNDIPADENNLPPGWFAAIDEDSGDQYYCNELTGETTWDPPAIPASIENDATNNNPNQAPVGSGDDDLLPGWFAVTDPSSGDVYYCNDSTGETTWDRPSASGNLDMSRLSINDNTVYEDDSVTSSQY